MEAPSMPGVKMDLAKLTGAGTGEVTLDLGQLLPSDAAVVSQLEFQMGLNRDGQKQTLSMKMDMAVRVEPGKRN
jgi:hypothetical protein